MDRIQDIIDDLRNGRMVLVMDDEDRENEGDLLIAAEKATPDDINFMANYGRGLICLTLTREQCRQIDLPMMVNQNNCHHGTNFTMSINASRGVTKGISAADRARTIRSAIADAATPADLVQPGYIFPLMAQPGGVLTRAGHTEAGCDLARLAGLKPSAVIVEVLNEDGTMARRPDLEVFAKKHNIRIGTIADLIEFRIQNEKTIERKNTRTLSTEFGDFNLVVYEDSINQDQHFALTRGYINADETVTVRVHVHNPVRDLIGTITDEYGWSIRSALKYISQQGKGVVVILQNQADSTSSLDQLNNSMDDNKQDNIVNLHSRKNLRMTGMGSQIIHDLGIRKIRVLGSPKKMPALSGFGLEVTDYIGAGIDSRGKESQACTREHSMYGLNSSR
jgi:3,4-dihydroxy 2-butanone 4-phosphate synthase/GTP cyclohydrolase II